MQFLKAAVMAIALLFSAISVGAQTQGEPQAVPDQDRLGALVDILKDDALRQQLIGKLEQLQRGETSEPGPVQTEEVDSVPAASIAEAQAAPDEEAVFSGGLMTGISQWFNDLGGRLPTAALGAPIDVKFVQAEAQVNRRLAAPGAIDGIQEFGWKSLLGWLAITVLAWLAYSFSRRRITARVARGARGQMLWRQVAVRLVYAVLPLIVCIGVAMVWTYLLSYSEVGSVAFIMLAVPFAGAVAVSGIMSALLVLLAPSKGWRLVTYAQRRLSPLVGILIGIAMAGSIAITPEMRAAIGPATSDIVALLLDIAVPIFAIVIVVLHRRTVRSLIVRGHSNDGDRSAFDRSIYWIGTHWQHFGFLFAILNIGARLFGAQSGSFLTQSSLSVAVIVIAFIAVASIRRFEVSRQISAARRKRVGVRSEILMRLASVVYRAAQVVMVVAAAILCIGFWGIDVAGWLASTAGVAVIGPVLSIIMVMLVAWTLWVALDAWITAALSEPKAGSGQRERSARIRTLLPLLRNVAFVVLSVLTVIAVLANLGINVAPLIAGAGVVGLAVGFGSQQLVQDVITGLFILLEDTLAIGDVIDTGDRAGTVEALTIRTVKIRDGDGALHTIPFSNVKALKNSSRGFGVYTVGIMLDQRADVATALDVLRDVGDEVYRDPKFSASIISPLDIWGVDQVGPDGILIKGAIRTRPLQQYSVGREINRRMNLRLHELGIPLANRNTAWSPPAA